MKTTTRKKKKGMKKEKRCGDEKMIIKNGIVEEKSAENQSHEHNV
jgi:hypothetical protein